MEVMAGTFVAEISRRGDPRIVDPAPMVADFMRDVAQMAQPFPGTAAELILRGLECRHVFLEDIGPRSTVGEMLDLGLSRTQMKIAARVAGVDFDKVVRRLKPEHIPTWLLERTLVQHLPDSRKREGGELTDTHLACLGLYADLTLVDKRTLEGFRRLRRRRLNWPAFSAKWIGLLVLNKYRRSRCPPPRWYKPKSTRRLPDLIPPRKAQRLAASASTWRTTMSPSETYISPAPNCIQRIRNVVGPITSNDLYSLMKQTGGAVGSKPVLKQDERPERLPSP